MLNSTKQPGKSRVTQFTLSYFGALLCSVGIFYCAFADTTPTHKLKIGAKRTTLNVVGALHVDSALRLPKRPVNDTARSTGNPLREKGVLFYDSIGDKLYLYKKDRFVLVTGGADSSLYSTDGTVPTKRVVTMQDTIYFKGRSVRFDSVWAHKYIKSEDSVSGKNVIASDTARARFVNGVDSVRGKFVRGSDSVVGKFVRGQDSVVGKFVRGQDSVVGKFVRGQDSVVGKFVRGQDSVVGKFVRGQDSVVGKFVRGQDSVVGKFVRGEDSVVGKFVRGQDSVVGKFVRGSDSVLGQLVRVDSALLAPFRDATDTTGSNGKMRRGGAIFVSKDSKKLYFYDGSHFRSVQDGRDSSLYSTDGTVPTKRVVTMQDTIYFKGRSVRFDSVWAHKYIKSEDSISGKNVIASDTARAKFVNGVDSVRGKFVRGQDSVVGKFVRGSDSVVGKFVRGQDSVVGKFVRGQDSVVGKFVRGSDSVVGKFVRGQDSVVGKFVRGQDSVVGKFVRGQDSVVGKFVRGQDSVVGKFVHGSDSVLGQLVRADSVLAIPVRDLKDTTGKLNKRSGALFVAKDKKNLYFYDGEKFKPVGSGTDSNIYKTNGTVAQARLVTLKDTLGFRGKTVYFDKVVAKKNTDSSFMSQDSIGTKVLRAHDSIITKAIYVKDSVKARFTITDTTYGLTGYYQNISSFSDERLKENIVSVDSALDRVQRLRGVYYHWKNKNKAGAQRQLGLIAQEVEKVVPEVVTQTNTPQKYKTVSYDKLVSLLIEAVKAQQVTIQKLEQRIDKLEKSQEKIDHLLELESKVKILEKLISSALGEVQRSRAEE